MLKKPSGGRKLLFGLFRLFVCLDEQNKPDEPDRPVSRFVLWAQRT
jgi:hypothetical protein